MAVLDPRLLGFRVPVAKRFLISVESSCSFSHLAVYNPTFIFQFYKFDCLLVSIRTKILFLVIWNIFYRFADRSQQKNSSTAQKMELSIKDFFSKCDQIRNFLRIWSNLLKKSLMENSIFCAVSRVGVSGLFFHIIDSFYRNNNFCKKNWNNGIMET